MHSINNGACLLCEPDIVVCVARVYIEDRNFRMAQMHATDNIAETNFVFLILMHIDIQC